MVKTAQSVWATRLVTFLLAAVAAGSAVYWVLKWPAAAAPVASAPAVAPSAPDTAAVARAMGGGAAAAPAASPEVAVSSRFVLAGVVASGAQHGAALIAVDGKPARPYRVGTVVADPWMLHAVQARRAVLRNSSGAELALDLPPKK